MREAAWPIGEGRLELRRVDGLQSSIGDDLRAAIAAADPKSPDPQLALLAKMDEDGVLDAYVLLARADEGIAHDHAEAAPGPLISSML